MRTPGSRVFVYSCPETSPPRLRMVYSTASAATLAQIQELGCRITHRLSLFASKECTLIAVAATIRNGQAQRVDTDKSVDLVVNYLPSTPARSLPSRFAANTTKALDAFTDEDGFRKAFTGVRPDAPAPAPFANKAPKPVLSPASSFMRTQSPQVNSDDGVDTSPNTGAAAWGVQLKSGPKGVAVPRVSFSNPSMSQTPAVSGSITTTTTTTYTTSFASTSSLVNRANVPRSDSFGSSKSFVQFRLAGETGDETPLSGNSTSTSTNTSNSKAATPEIMHSSIPGLRRVTNAGLTDNTDNKTKPNGTTSTTTGGSWDPWRSVSTVTSFKSGPPIQQQQQQQQQSVPESALQSSVFVRNDDTDSSSILAFMSDITYPPLQSNTPTYT
ncbi:hypothetical protein LPJ66_009686 [Kickxella alabastrina]|uniref:Uncharacterized protein n=1 Tax=Kickxella alabastrina TaxID=61397 RepID=A0ACC1I6C1_9FUNG|nr:hypothetical protein LPJ66_009686 [Kickxella alabastrina]